VSDFYVESHVQRGELQRVLPQWCLEPTAAWAVFPGRRLLPARTRVFIDAVVAALKPCEDAAGEALASHGLAPGPGIDSATASDSR
jgi:DNA-binding transcriptional LysR family regulator